MSNLIHCDGPDCDTSSDPAASQYRLLGEMPWIHVEEEGSPPRDFHSTACLAAWAARAAEAGSTWAVDGR